MSDQPEPSGDPALDAALADREAEVEAGAGQAEAPADRSPPGEVSPRAYDLIVQHETGGRAYYERVIKSRPVWPGGGSGVTIGFGYDLGFVSEAKLRRDWAALGPAALDRLAAAVGRRGGAPAEMKALAHGLRDIHVSWEAGEAVFNAVTLPDFRATTWNRLPNCSRLSKDSYGALVSLTFNRGPSFDKPGPRFREMREIKAAMTAARFDAVPGLIRSMKRIWVGTSLEPEMSRRRENEARLFADGLKGAAGRAEGLVAPEPDDEAVGSGPTDEDSWPDPDDEEAIQGAAEGPPGEGVRWAADAQSVDYAHLAPGQPVGSTFDFTAEDLRRLCTANAFPVDDLATPVLFGLRGCTIVQGGDSGFQDRVVLKDLRPDHDSTRCVMGVWDRAGGRIAVFPGSTVPNRAAVASWKATRKHGNLLPTGFYRYIVGPHNGKPGCFLLRRSMTEFRQVIVRRSSDDLCYEQTDVRDPCTPGDNIHPAFFAAPKFSSLGCQTVAGHADKAGNHSGAWSRFRAAAGLGANTPDGTPYGYVLLTGAEARLSASGQGGDLRRLRFGSRGEAVRRLQTRLGLPEPDGGFGPNTSLAWHQRQEAGAQGRSDGVYTPAADAALGWDVLGAP